MVNYSEDYQIYLTPIEADSPCGPNLEYDPGYIELFNLLIPKLKPVIEEREKGRRRLENIATPVNWAEVESGCLEQMERTRDVRLLCLFIRCLVKSAQGPGLCRGLGLLLDSLKLWPRELHPAVGTDNDFGPRLAALSELSSPEGLLADIRNLPLSADRSISLQVRDAERDQGEAATGQILRELNDARDQAYLHLVVAVYMAEELDNLIQRECRADQSLAGLPGASGLVRILKKILPPQAEPEPQTLKFDQEAKPEAPVGAAKKSPSRPPRRGGAQPEPDKTPETVMDRETAKAQMRMLRLWFIEHEPSSPIPILLAQAEKMVGKPFSELVSVIPLELLEKWKQEP